MKNKIELFGHQKVQKVQIFWVTKKIELFGEKKFKKFREFFFEKNQKWNFLNFWNFLIFF